jgi:hypothetical protein
MSVQDEAVPLEDVPFGAFFAGAVLRASLTPARRNRAIESASLP